MKNWKVLLKFDPIHTLLSTENKAIRYFVRRDLLEERSSSVDCLSNLSNI